VTELLHAFLDDLVDSMRDGLAYVLFTVFVAWLYAPEVLP
jgi:hypothetical protein